MSTVNIDRSILAKIGSTYNVSFGFIFNYPDILITCSKSPWRGKDWRLDNIYTSVSISSSNISIDHRNRPKHYWKNITSKSPNSGDKSSSGV